MSYSDTHDIVHHFADRSVSCITGLMYGPDHSPLAHGAQKTIPLRSPLQPPYVTLKCAPYIHVPTKMHYNNFRNLFIFSICYNNKCVTIWFKLGKEHSDLLNFTAY